MDKRQRQNNSQDFDISKRQSSTFITTQQFKRDSITPEMDEYPIIIDTALHYGGSGKETKNAR